MIKLQGESCLILNVNGQAHSVIARPSDLLLDVLRLRLGLTGAKPGCKNGDCGVCTVLIDGWPAKSCLVLAVEAQGHEITTIEGLCNTPVQTAFVNHSAFQCGYCTSGFLLVAHALLQRQPNCDELTMEEWLQSNLCRCTSYKMIRQALKGLIE